MGTINHLLTSALIPSSQPIINNFKMSRAAMSPFSFALFLCACCTLTFSHMAMCSKGRVSVDLSAAIYAHAVGSSSATLPPAAKALVTLDDEQLGPSSCTLYNLEESLEMTRATTYAEVGGSPCTSWGQSGADALLSAANGASGSDAAGHQAAGGAGGSCGVG